MNEEVYKTFLDALTKVQAELPIIEMDAENPHFKSKYAAWKALVKGVMPVLTRHGFSIRFKTRVENDREYYVLLLGHKDGYVDESIYPIKPTKPGIQEIGSQMTYLKRYMLMAITGVACAVDVDDDDGEKDRKDNTVEPIDYITVEQRDIIDSELDKLDPDLAPEIAQILKAKFNVDNLGNLQKSHYEVALKVIREAQ